MFRDIKVTEYYCTKDPNLKEIMYDADRYLDIGLYADHKNFIYDNMRMFKRHNYSEEINIEEYKGRPWNYDLKYTNPKDVNDIFKLRFEISDMILPPQEYDPFRYIDENMYGAKDNWWMFMVNVNNILCYTHHQAFNAIQVLTGMIDRPWQYE